MNAESGIITAPAPPVSRPQESASKAWARALESIRILQERPELTLPLLVQELGAVHGDRPALLGEGDTLSFRELAARAAHYADWAAAQGIRPGQVVGLLMPNCAEYAAIWLGLSRTGAVVALLNGNLQGNALLHCIRTARCSHLIVGAELWKWAACVLPELTQTACWLHGVAPGVTLPRVDLPTAAAGDAPPPARPPDLALLIFTSGTTGLPKAARITHARLLEWSFWFAAMMDVTAEDRLYNCLPMYHSTGGVVGIGAMLVRGGSAVIRKRFSASRFWNDIVRTECTIFLYIGELCRYLLLSRPDSQENSHRLRLCCGNGMRGDVWTQFQERFGIPRVLEFYAATEGNVSLYNCEGKPGAIGRVPGFLAHRFPIALVKCDPVSGEILRDDAGRCMRCAPGEPGEAIGKVQAAAESRFDGYTDEKASAAKLLHDVFAAGDRWFRTGDLMRKDEAGYYYFVDRLGDSFRWKGENVSTAEVAEILRGCPGVREAVVFGIAIPGNEGKAGMAAITTDYHFSLRRLQAHLVQTLPSYARPVFIRRCRSLQATGTFKLVKAELERDGYAHAPASDPVWMFDPKSDRFVPYRAGLAGG